MIAIGKSCKQCLCAKCSKRNTCISNHKDMALFYCSECRGESGYMKTCDGYEPDSSWITAELRDLLKEARTCPGIPPGEYIGEEQKGEKIYYYYKDGPNYYYENSYSREMREKEKERRRSSRGSRMGKTRF